MYYVSEWVLRAENEKEKMRKFIFNLNISYEEKELYYSYYLKYIKDFFNEQDKNSPKKTYKEKDLMDIYHSLVVENHIFTNRLLCLLCYDYEINKDIDFLKANKEYFSPYIFHENNMKTINIITDNSFNLTEYCLSYHGMDYGMLCLALRHIIPVLKDFIDDHEEHIDDRLTKLAAEYILDNNIDISIYPNSKINEPIIALVKN